VPKFDSTKDYYKVLGVDRKASAEEIDRAFRTAARRRHPDGGGSEEEMKLLNEAHDVLSDPTERKVYDNERNPPQPLYASSVVFDSEAASAGGTLKIPVSDEDFAGLVMGTVTCFGLGLPLWLLVEMQWMFFLWPLRLISLGAIGLGVLTGHAALSARHRHLRKTDGKLRASTVALERAGYWSVVIGLVFLMAVFYLS
jgi:curved DNA-binding protein CbpA